jgi:hypothetical protein
MRLIPGSRYYECDSCQDLYVYFPLGLILLLGFIFFALGEGFVLSVLIANDIGIRYRGFGFHEKIGAVLGAFLALMGYLIIALWSLKALKKYKK